MLKSSWMYRGNPTFHRKETLSMALAWVFRYLSMGKSIVFVSKTGPCKTSSFCLTKKRRGWNFPKVRRRKRRLGSLHQPGGILHQQIIRFVSRNESFSKNHHLGKAITADTAISCSTHKILAYQIGISVFSNGSGSIRERTSQCKHNWMPIY